MVLPSLAKLGKGGVAAPSSKWPRSFERRGAKREPGRAKHQGRGGSFEVRQSVVEPTTPSAPAKVASHHYLNERRHPAFAKEGSFHVVNSYEPRTKRLKLAGWHIPHY